MRKKTYLKLAEYQTEQARQHLNEVRSIHSEMRGYEATEAIRAMGGKRGSIPIIAMTANAFEEDRKKALAAGMNAHIVKPIDIEIMLSTLGKYIA